MTNLSVEFLGRTLSSPLVLASGIWGSTTSLLARAAAQGCGAVTAKSCGPAPRPGHVNPSCIDWHYGLLNAIGLANPGAAAEAELLRAARVQVAAQDAYLIASIFAGTPAEFGQVAATVATAQPDFLEVNISCPNVGSEFGEPFAANPEAAAAVTAAVKAAVADQAIPVIVKLAPNVPSVARIACAVVEAGADALCAINTMPGMVIDAPSGAPVLSNRSGGISGPALKPIALKCVYDVRKACPTIPIIGTGGVLTGTDAVEMLMAGATLVGVGSAIHYRGPDTLLQIRAELAEWMAAHGTHDIGALQNRAHREPIFSAQPTGAPVPDAH
ncbi:MAG: dihydroorotate dehydrogenase [Litorilinea sp.]